jgi:hypothetical protein
VGARAYLVLVLVLLLVLLLLLVLETWHGRPARAAPFLFTAGTAVLRFNRGQDARVTESGVVPPHSKGRGGPVLRKSAPTRGIRATIDSRSQSPSRGDIISIPIDGLGRI